MTFTERRMLIEARLWLIVGILALVARISVTGYLLFTSYWWIAVVLVVAQQTTQATDHFFGKAFDDAPAV